MVDEFELTSPVKGSSVFSQEFSERGVRDSQGRSLYDLDLNHRLFRYSCSFLIYSNQFDGLPDRMKQYLGDRLRTILLEEPVAGPTVANSLLNSNASNSKNDFSRLSSEERKVLAEILADTKPEFWNEYVLPRGIGG